MADPKWFETKIGRLERKVELLQENAKHWQARCTESEASVKWMMHRWDYLKHLVVSAGGPFDDADAILGLMLQAERSARTFEDADAFGNR